MILGHSLLHDCFQQVKLTSCSRCVDQLQQIQQMRMMADSLELLQSLHVKMKDSFLDQNMDSTSVIEVAENADLVVGDDGSIGLVCEEAESVGCIERMRVEHCCVLDLVLGR